MKIRDRDLFIEQKKSRYASSSFIRSIVFSAYFY